MNASLANPDFTRSVNTLRRIIPGLSFGLLISTYLVSAIIMGLFHAQDSTSIGFTIAAFIVPLAIQTGRGTLVFFFQLNPSRVQRRLSFGIWAATALLLLSLCEACLVMWPHGLSWTISVSTLMIIGWIIEVMILKETQFTSELELYSDPARVKELKQFYVARKEFAEFMEDLHENRSYKTLYPQEEEQGACTGERKKNLSIINHKDSNHSRLGKKVGRL